MSTPAALEGIRVIELSGVYGGYCGKMFSGLGAEVILVEPETGSPLRQEPPFDHESGVSLNFAYQHTNKRSIVLDLESDKGLQDLDRIAATASLVIVSDFPARNRVNFSRLQALNPALVVTSISPYGLTGPYADYVADDLTLMAMGGFLNMGGYADGIPTVAYGEQAYRAADQFAAVASMTAVLSAEKSGKGELIDVAIQECVVMALENAAQTYDLTGVVRQREGGDISTAGTGIYPCKDGEVYLLAAGVGETNMWSNFIDWMIFEGITAAREFESPNWNDIEYRKTPQAIARFSDIFLPFSTTRTKQELYDAGRNWRVPMAPVNKPSDVLQSQQLAYRQFFIRTPEIGGKHSLLMPGAPYKFSKTPWQITSAAPNLGEHNDDLDFLALEEER